MRRLVPVLIVGALFGGSSPAQGVLPPLAAGAVASANVEFVATVPEPGAFGGRIIGDVMYVTTTQGVRTYDVSGPLGIPVLLGALNIPHFGNEDVDTNGRILLVATDHGLSTVNTLYVVDVTNPRLPLLASRLTFSVARAHTASCILDCDYAWVAGSSSITVVDLRTPTAPVVAGRFFRDGSSNPTAGGFGLSHDVNVDATGLAWVSSGAGLFVYDPSNPVTPTLVASRPNGTATSFDNQFILHNSMRPNAGAATPASLGDGDVDPGELVLVTEEDWTSFSNGLCADDGSFQTGWVHTVGGVLTVDRLDFVNLGRFGPPLEQRPQPVATCSSHFFDYRADGVAAVAWYEQGIRFFDVSDPSSISTIGWYVPANAVSLATLFHNGVLYTFDLGRGIDVLRFNGTAGSAAVAPPPLRPAPAAGLAPSPVFGFGCRVAAT